jgi:oligopeptide transport system ATP-binding protein
MSLLEVSNLSKSFRRRRLFGEDSVVDAVKGVSFTMERAHTTAIVGESGAGKSTTARLVLRLIDPDEGSIIFDGCDLRALSASEMRKQRRHLQMVFQDPYGSMDPRIPIGRSVAEPMRVHLGTNRVDREREARSLLRRVGLGEHLFDRLPHQLSGGQLQRVSIARALSVDPEIIVCDEAVAALDVSIRAQVLNLLADLQEERKISYLFIAHDLAIVEAFADHVLVMRGGQMVESGSTEQVYGNPSQAYTQELLNAIPNPDPTVRRD